MAVIYYKENNEIKKLELPVGGGTIVNGVTIKQIKYTGDDTDNKTIEIGSNAIIFMTEGMGKGGNYMRLNPCILEKDRKVQCQGQYGGGSGLYCYSKYDGKNIILSGGADAGARANASGESYVMTVFYKEDDESSTPVSPTQHIYDDTEKIVGKWFGKNLYERTIDVDCTGSAYSWIDTSVVIENADTFVYASGINNDKICFPLTAAQTNSIIIMHYRNGVNVNFKKVTIQYTKTTD